MAQMAFTDRGVRALPVPDKPKEARYFERRERGLSLMLNCSYTGARTWHLLFYRNGRPTTKKLGSYPEMTVAEARTAANKADPEAAAASANAGTFKRVAEDWIADHVDKKGLRSKPEIERHLKMYVYPAWANRRIFDINRLDVNKLLRDIETRKISYVSTDKKRPHRRKTIGGPAQADAVLATIRGIMTWYAVQDHNYTTPIVRGMKRDKRSIAERSRKRILTDDEIRNVWTACDDLGTTFGALVQMLLLTGQRRNKVAEMWWDDVADDGTWTARTAHREKGHIEAVRLPKMARDVLERLPEVDDNDHVFPAAYGNKPLNSFSQGKTELDAKLPDDMPGWTLHDLRRTARSLMAKLGVPRDIAERTLGHKQQGVEAVYDRFDYTPQKTEALQKLADYITLILNPAEGTNIVPLRQPQADALAKG